MRKKLDLVAPAGVAAFGEIMKVARSTGRNHQVVGLRYALERFLSRVFASTEADRLCLDPSNMAIGVGSDAITLKGGMVMCFAEDGDPLKSRSTSDADLHLAGFSGTMEDYAAILRLILSGPSNPDDGIRWDVSAITVSRQRDERTGGTVTIPLQIGETPFQIRSDCTFDRRPMHEGAPVQTYPTVMPSLGLPLFAVRRVPWPYMVSDKVAAMSSLGMGNYRIRDYHDVHLVLERRAAELGTLPAILAATYAFKGLVLPVSTADMPALSDAFVERQGSRWLQEGAVKRYGVTVPFSEVVAALRSGLDPVFASARDLAAADAWEIGDRPF
jgi:hypothetical protein